MSKNSIFYLVIFLEGFVLLSSELLAIRLMTPFVGAGTEVIAIIIAAVLMPLSIGYFYGGKKRSNIRNTLVRNFSHSIIFFTFGFSYLFLIYFFHLLNQLSISNYLLQTICYSLLFLVYPVYLLGQTIPLISNYLSTNNISSQTGKILCFSTLGSFAGSIITSLILMNLVGVHNTVISLISALIIMLGFITKPKLSLLHLIVFSCLLLTLIFNNSIVLKKLNIVANNQYNTIYIFTKPDNTKILSINHSYSSQYNKNNSQQFKYVKFINDLLPKKNKKILIIGAGGFTIGVNDTKNYYTYIDIDKDLKSIAEKYFLEKKLTTNKVFITMPARAFVAHTKEKFDYIILDAYSNRMNMPQQLLTIEFFSKVKSLLTAKGVFVFNAIASPSFNDTYSCKLDNTLRSVFTKITRQIMSLPTIQNSSNILYIYFANSLDNNETYTDLKNSYYTDK